MTSKARLAGFVAVTMACALGLAAYVMRGSTSTPETSPRTDDVPADAAALAGQPHVLFTNAELRAGNGQLAIAALADPDGSRRLSPLFCDRVDFDGGIGVCLAADRGMITTYSALIFDRSLSKVLHTLPLDGIPSRVRVAPNGQVAGITVFVAGHSYTSNDFSTKTTLIDTRTGSVIADLETFDVRKNGAPFKAVDFNFWGVTFLASSDAFYATLGSGGVFYLVKGDIAGKRVTVEAAGVECPALSPDGTRIAYKKRSSGGGSMLWKLAVRDLATGTERLLEGESRSIDDQVEWLDDRRILYAVADTELGPSATSVWVIEADGGSPSRRWLSNGFSPSVSPTPER